MGYEKARGAITWVPDGKTPEQVIRKMRGDHTECEETITDLRCQLAETRTALKDVANALIGTTTTLDSVDPNAPSLEVAELVIEKHISTIGPLIEEARKRKEQ